MNSQGELVRRARTGNVSRESSEEVTAPVFVVGHPRSGTSLLAATIDRHPLFSVPPETQFFFRGARRKLSRFLPKKFRHTALWNCIHGILYGESSKKRALELFRDGPPTEKHLLDAIMTEFVSGNESRRWAEKSPWHLRRVPQILQTYPDAKIIAIIRDGRDCAESCVKVQFHQRSALWYAATWRYASRLLRRLKSRYPDSMLVMRFEDLVARPEEMTHVIDDFIGVEFDESQLDHSVPTKTFAEKSEPWKSRVNAPIDSSRSHAWQSLSDPRIVESYEAILGDELDAWEYPRAPDSKTLGSLRRFFLKVAYRGSCRVVMAAKWLLGRM